LKGKIIAGLCIVCILLCSGCIGDTKQSKGIYTKTGVVLDSTYSNSFWSGERAEIVFTDETSIIVEESSSNTTIYSAYLVAHTNRGHNCSIIYSVDLGFSSVISFKIND